ncbi:MAG: hypothetical protein QGG67_07250 [Gammaproteobacteria bacterium]|nr:hypothetical protein [Gammaproteobacteria bacterium]HJO12592.1 hypothetical protein [Gammaproteobacteria bacterium]
MFGHPFLRNGLLTTCSVLLLSSCGVFFSEGERPVNVLVCDSFLVYDMCAQDLDADGVVEFVYFDDNYEIFLYRAGTEDRVPDNLIMHRCAQEMDDNIIGSASRILYISDSTPLLEKTDIKGSMMISYISYMPRVASCNAAADEAEALSEI